MTKVGSNDPHDFELTKSSTTWLWIEFSTAEMTKRKQRELLIDYISF